MKIRPVWVFCPFWIRLFIFLILNYMSCFRKNFLLLISFANTFSFRKFLHFVDGFLCYEKAFKLNSAPFVYFYFLLPSRQQIKKYCYNEQLQIAFFFLFSSGILWFPDLYLGSLIHFKFNFIYDMRKCSNLILTCSYTVLK